MRGPLALLAASVVAWPAAGATPEAERAGAKAPWAPEARAGAAPAGPATPPALPGDGDRARAGGCRLFAADAHRAPAAECVGCHRGHDAHPVDVDLDARALRAGSSLRPAAEVVRRGVYLDGGRVTCLSCHDARSRWAARIALPPGARVRTAVDPRNAASYLRPAQETVDGRHLPDGAAVSPTPLCRACHTHGD